MNENLKIKFSAEHLPRVAMFMARQDIRYYLNGIYIEAAEKGGVYLVGCDGSTMAVIYDKDGMIEGATSVIMRATPGLISACKKADRKIGNPQVLVVGKRVSVAGDFGQEHTDIEEFVQPGNPWIDGKFPNWKKVLPNFPKLKRGLISSCLNSQYLSRFSKITKSRNNMDGINFWQESENSGVVVQHLNIPEMISIIMPMRDDAENMRKLFNQFPKKENEQ